jgi:REP element-mobilizing transposase RayT
MKPTSNNIHTMKSSPRKIHHRRSIRLKEFDYSREGAYFLTICTHKRECIFGNIIDEHSELSKYGHIVESVWMDLPKHYNNIQLDEFVIMPNHIHGIIFIVGAGFKPAPTTRYPLSEIIRGFKTFSSRKINESRNTPGVPVWQRNFYERVIRNDRELKDIREYVDYNPLKWGFDKENPIGIKDMKFRNQWRWLEGK